jgi:hypothetical protein
MWPEVFVPFLGLGFPRLRRVLLSFASPKESKQRKGDPGSAPAAPVPCATRLTRGLRNSGFALRQCSPFFRASLRCSAPLKGPGKPSGLDRPFFDFGLFFGSTVGAAFVSMVATFCFSGGSEGTGADPGGAFSLATFFWRSKRKYARPQGGKQGLKQQPTQKIIPTFL